MKVDIRTKLLIVALFSILALAYQDPRMLAIILALNLMTVTLFRIPLSTFFKFKKFLSMYIILIIVQSFFVQGGDPLIKLGNLYFLTTEGILYGLSIILRFFILVGSGIILWQCNTAELLLALVKMRIPYEIVFMTQLGMRFIPVFINELQNIFNVIQLRGVDLRKVYKRKVINVYLSIFTPLIYSVWQKAEKLSILLELRGFRKSPTRTYYRDISLHKIDYVIMALSLLVTLVIIHIGHII